MTLVHPYLVARAAGPSYGRKTMRLIAYGTGGRHSVNDGCQDCDANHVIEFPADAACPVIMWHDVICQLHPL